MSEMIARIALLAVPVLFSITFHEVCHGYAAYRFGDPTAKMAGRLTLNPLPHIDIVGLIVLLVTSRIGWAKPVPVDVRYFKHPRRDMMWVALAGPASNLCLAVLAAVVFKFVGPVPAQDSVMFPLIKMLEITVWINVGLAVFNLLPIPPLDGGHIIEGLLPARHVQAWKEFERYGFIILIVLIFFTRVIDVVIIPIIATVGTLLFSI